MKQGLVFALFFSVNWVCISLYDFLLSNKSNILDNWFALNAFGPTLIPKKEI